MISSQTLSRISAILQSISTDDVPKSWWTEFSTWRDFKALLRTGSVLSIHKVVKYMTENFENIHGFDVAIDTIDENGNIEITITEDTEDIFQGFTVKAKRKRLRRLQDIAAFNLAQHLVSEVEVESLNIPQTLISVVKRFLVTYSGSYIIDMKTKQSVTRHSKLSFLSQVYFLSSLFRENDCWSGGRFPLSLGKLLNIINLNMHTIRQHSAPFGCIRLYSAVFGTIRHHSAPF